jgi:hypothetical protein
VALGVARFLANATREKLALQFTVTRTKGKRVVFPGIIFVSGILMDFLEQCSIIDR